MRFFVPRQNGPGFAPTYPTNPWSDAFSAGTQISTGLELAHTIATRNGVHRPAVRAQRQVRRDAAIVLRQLGHHLAPEVAVHEQAVNEHDRLARAALAVRDGSLWERQFLAFPEC